MRAIRLEMLLFVSAGLALGAVLGAERHSQADKPSRLVVVVQVSPSCSVSISDVDADPAGGPNGGVISVTIGCVTGAQAAVTLESSSTAEGSAYTFYEDSSHKVAWADKAGGDNTHVGTGASSDKKVYVRMPPRRRGVVIATVLF